MEFQIISYIYVIGIVVQHSFLNARNFLEPLSVYMGNMSDMEGLNFRPKYRKENSTPIR